ncbi:(d)CMP kinase [Bartonella sp. DGB1]|uniref:(d)CMP kinase n=1 Tax=Bartonella sp. DGB1 TaxID=3239807 RepID=UPI00352315FA
MKLKHKNLIITIDGPAASGKGTLARNIACHYELTHLDTGLIYRQLAYQMIINNCNFNDEDEAAKQAIYVDFNDFDKDKLKAYEISKISSIVAAFPKVRAILLKKQQDFIKLHQENGIILDGRDTGTIICPTAPLKFFITADINERAKRRFNELKPGNNKITFAEILKSLQERDERDKNRKYAPLKKADDAMLLDTTEADINTLFTEVKKIIDLYLSQG